MRRSLVRARCREIGELVRAGTPVCVVSSGAIALGLPGSDRRRGRGACRSCRRRPRSARHGCRRSGTRHSGEWASPLRRCSSPPRTSADRAAYVNARNTLAALLGLGVVPVVNENDATATDEITFGDNDALAAQVAILVKARLLVLLTEVEGVYTRAPGTPGAELVEHGAAARDAHVGSGSALGKGGMRSKIVAAELAASSGIPTVIAARRRRGRPRPARRRRAPWHALSPGRAGAVCLQALAASRKAGRPDGCTSTPAPGGLSSRTGRACSPSASRLSRAGSSRASGRTRRARRDARSPRASPAPRAATSSVGRAVSRRCTATASSSTESEERGQRLARRYVEVHELEQRTGRDECR